MTALANALRTAGYVSPEEREAESLRRLRNTAVASVLEARHNHHKAMLVFERMIRDDPELLWALIKYVRHEAMRRELAAATADINRAERLTPAEAQAAQDEIGTPAQADDAGGGGQRTRDTHSDGAPAAPIGGIAADRGGMDQFAADAQPARVRPSTPVSETPRQAAGGGGHTRRDAHSASASPSPHPAPAGGARLTEPDTQSTTARPTSSSPTKPRPTKPVQNPPMVNLRATARVGEKTIQPAAIGPKKPMLEWVLRGMTKTIGDLTGFEARNAAIRFDRDKKWLDLLAEKVPDETTIRQCRTEADVISFFREANAAASRESGGRGVPPIGTERQDGHSGETHLNA